MHSLMIVNAVMYGLLFAVWTKSNLMNFVIKIGFLTLLVLNVIQAAKL